MSVKSFHPYRYTAVFIRNAQNAPRRNAYKTLGKSEKRIFRLPFIGRGGDGTVSENKTCEKGAHDEKRSASEKARHIGGFMKKDEKNTKEERKVGAELDDEELNGVAGGAVIRLRHPKIDVAASAVSEFLCYCAACGIDTAWALSEDGLSVFCASCGAEKDRVWFENNKIRKKGGRIE